MSSSADRLRLLEIYQHVTTGADYNAPFVSWLRQEAADTPGFGETSAALSATDPAAAVDAIRAMLAALSVTDQTSMRERASALAETYLEEYEPDELIWTAKFLALAPHGIHAMSTAAREFSRALRAGPAQEPDAEGLSCLASILSRGYSDIDATTEMIVRFASAVLATPAAAVLAGIGSELGGNADDPDPSNGIMFLTFNPRAVWELHTFALDASLLARPDSSPGKASL